MRLDKSLHEDDSDDDENDPDLILILISSYVEYNNDLPYVRKYLLFHQARYEPYINTPFWNTLPLPTQKFISEVYAKKKDIHPSLDPHIDELFESSHPDDLSSRVVDHFSSLENTGISAPMKIRKKWYELDEDEEFLSEDDKEMDEFMGQMYAACGLPPISSYSSRSPSPVLVFYDNTSLVFLSNSDDNLMDSDDESSFLPFDDETLDYHGTEWIELIFRSVCFSFIPIYIRSPSFSLELSIISSRRFPAPLPPPSSLDQRVTYGHRMYWKLFVCLSGPGEFLVAPSLTTADFKFYDRIYFLQPSVYDQITRFAGLFEIFAGLLLLLKCVTLP
ncbi:unnamed protein product [Rhizophagus irregularis]|nr:unnamed protein product [Rhizophagus irregularis]